MVDINFICRPLLHCSCPICGPSSPRLVITSSQPRRCHSSSPPHAVQSGFGVSFTLNPALWLDPVKPARQSDTHTLIHRCDLSALTSPRRSSNVFVFSAVAKLCVPSELLRCDSPERYDSVEDMIASVRLMFWWWAYVGHKKKGAVTLDAPLVCRQGDIEGLKVKSGRNS